MDRRKFIKAVGVGAAAVVVPMSVSAAPTKEIDNGCTPLCLKVKRPEWGTYTWNWTDCSIEDIRKGDFYQLFDLHGRFIKEGTINLGGGNMFIAQCDAYKVSPSFWRIKTHHRGHPQGVLTSYLVDKRGDPEPRNFNNWQKQTMYFTKDKELRVTIDSHILTREEVRRWQPPRHTKNIPVSCYNGIETKGWEWTRS